MNNINDIVEILDSSIYETYPDFNKYLKVILNEPDIYEILFSKTKQYLLIFQMDVISKHCYLHTLYLSPSVRMKGLGKNIFNEFIHLCKRYGITHVYTKVRKTQNVVFDVLINKFGFKQIKSDQPDVLSNHLVYIIEETKYVYKTKYLNNVKTKMELLK